MNPTAPDREGLFWRLADELFADPAVTRSTMMGYPCLRAHGKFFACVDRRTGDLVVKLPPVRVDELVAEGVGVPFAPNGKVFRAWAAIPIPDDEEWSALLDEAKAFALG
jgi:YjbR